MPRLPLGAGVGCVRPLSRSAACAVFFHSSGNSGKSVRYTLSPPSQSAAFKVMPASPDASKRANLEHRRLGWLLVSVGRLGRMAVFVSRKNNHWLSSDYFFGRPDKVTFPSRPAIHKLLSVTAGRPLAVAKRRVAPFTAVTVSGRLNKGRTLFPEFPDEPKKSRFPDRKRGCQPRTEEWSPCRHHHEDGKKGSLEIDINRPITEGESMRCLAPVVFIESLTKEKK